MKNNKKKVVLVTGCTGFVGGNFITAYKKKYKDATVIGVSTAQAKRAIKDLPCTIYEGSVTDYAFLESVFKKHEPTHVVHLAGNSRVAYAKEEPIKSTELHVNGTLNVLVLSEKYKVERVVYASSVAVYDSLKKIPLKESSGLFPYHNLYSVQKVMSENLCKTFCTRGSMDTISLRFFQMYGPLQYGYSSVVSTWLESLYFPKETKPFIEGDGTQARDFCFIEDAVLAIILSLHSRKTFKGEVVNIASGVAVSLLELKDTIERATKKTIALDRRPPREGEVKYSVADISKAKELLGYTPKTSLTSGIKKTVAWFKQRKN